MVTIGALLGMAAHLEGKGGTVLDMTGLAQKNGAVISHVRIADRRDALHAARIAAGEADLVLGCDIVAGVGYEALAKMQRGVTRALVNTGAGDAGAASPATRTCGFRSARWSSEIEDAVARRRRRVPRRDRSSPPG